MATQICPMCGGVGKRTQIDDSTACSPTWCNACGGTGYLSATRTDGYISNVPELVPPIGGIKVNLTRNQVDEAIEHLKTRADEEAKAIEDWKVNNIVPKRGDAVHVTLNGIVVDVLDSHSCLMFMVYLDHSGKVVEVIVPNDGEDIKVRGK